MTTYHAFMLRFLLRFTLILVALFIAELTPPVQNALVIPWTAALVQISGGLITLVDSDVVAVGKVLQSTRNGFAVSVEMGCNGIEAAIVLITAILAFPAPWKYRLLGALAGMLAVQLLNIVRVISLFYLGQWNTDVFEWAHQYLWQTMIMLDVLVVWLIWIRLLPPNASLMQSPIPAVNSVEKGSAPC